MLCTSLAILQLWGIKFPRELLRTSDYSEWSLSEGLGRLFHLLLLRSFRACKPPTSNHLAFFLYSHKTVTRNIPRYASIQGNHISTIQKSTRLAENTQLMMHRLSITVLMRMIPNNSYVLDKDDVSCVIKRQSFTTVWGGKASLCPFPWKAGSTALGKPAAASCLKSRLMS